MMVKIFSNLHSASEAFTGTATRPNTAPFHRDTAQRQINVITTSS